MTDGSLSFHARGGVRRRRPVSSWLNDYLYGRALCPGHSVHDPRVPVAAGVGIRGFFFPSKNTTLYVYTIVSEFDRPVRTSDVFFFFFALSTCLSTFSAEYFVACARRALDLPPQDRLGLVPRLVPPIIDYRQIEEAPKTGSLCLIPSQNFSHEYRYVLEYLRLIYFPNYRLSTSRTLYVLCVFSKLCYIQFYII